MEAAEEADLNHEYNASLVVSPLGSGWQAGWLCPTPTAAGTAAVQGAEQQLLNLCPCAMLRPGFVSEVFTPAAEAPRDGMESACGVDRRALGSGQERGGSAGMALGEALGKLKYKQVSLS